MVAIPLTDVYQTLNRLLAVEALVTAGVLVGLGLLAAPYVKEIGKKMLKK